MTSSVLVLLVILVNILSISLLAYNFIEKRKRSIMLTRPSISAKVPEDAHGVVGAPLPGETIKKDVPSSSRKRKALQRQQLKKLRNVASTGLKATVPVVSQRKSTKSKIELTQDDVS